MKDDPTTNTDKLVERSSRPHLDDCMCTECLMADDGDIIEAQATRITDLQAKLEQAREALGRISRFTHVDAFNDERPSHEATIARKALASLGDAE